jgi:hypothetical protein
MLMATLDFALGDAIDALRDLVRSSDMRRSR